MSTSSGSRVRRDGTMAMSSKQMCIRDRFAVEAGLLDLVDHHVVGVAQYLGAFAGHLADDPHAQPGARERLAPYDLGGQAELLADVAHLVLEQAAQGLDQVEREVLGQASDVVVALDAVSYTHLPAR